jgi:hypothetical protein
MQEPYVILFAGVPDVGRLAAVNYISIRLNLPVFSNDALRYETRLQNRQLQLDVPKFDTLRDERFGWVLKNHKSFIYDAGIDRRWPELKPELEKNGYSWKIISFNLSDELAQKLWREVSGNQPNEDEPNWLRQHADFVKKHGFEVDLKITDSELPHLIVELGKHFQL